MKSLPELTYLEVPGVDLAGDTASDYYASEMLKFVAGCHFESLALSPHSLNALGTVPLFILPEEEGLTAYALHFSQEHNEFYGGW